MPDFDKNLDPIIKPKNLELEIGVNPALPDIQQGFGIDIGEVTTAGDDDGNRGGYSRLFTDLSAQSQKKAAAGRGDAPMLATYDVLKANSRWGIYNPNIQDPEEYKALGQSAADQWGNAFVKFGAFTLGTFAQSFNQIPKMLGLAGARGDNYVARLSGLDTYEEDIDNWYKNMEDWFPNYVTKWEREHPFQAALGVGAFKGRAGFANFWGDKFLKNAGFTVGAIGGAIATDAIITGITGGIGALPAIAGSVGALALRLNKIFATTSRVDKVLDTARALGKTEQQLLNIRKIGEIAQGTKLLNKGRFLVNLLGASSTEASIESRQGYNDVKNSLIEKYKDEYGTDPSGKELKDIEDHAQAAMNTRYGINMALLLTSNAIQWDNMLRPFESSKWGLKSSLAQSIDDGVKIKLKDGSLDVFEEVGPTTFRGKLAKAIKPVVPSILSEGVFEEGGQFAAERGTYDYYTRAYDAKKNKRAWDAMAEAMKSFNYGLEEQFGSTEGLESMFLGALTGAAFSGGRAAFDKYFGNDELKKSSVLAMLNSQGVTGLLGDRVNEGINSVEIKDNLIKAVKNNNVFDFKNLRHRELFNFVVTGLKANRFDVRMEQLKMLKELTNDQFMSMFGIDPTIENKKTASEYVDALMLKANEIRDTYNSVNEVYANNPFKYYNTPKNSDQEAESENWKTYEAWKTELSYLTSIGQDAKRRQDELYTEISKIAPVNKNTLITLFGNKTPSQEALNKIAEETKTAIPKEKEASLIKLVNDFGALATRERVSSALFAYLSDENGALKFFEESERLKKESQKAADAVKKQKSRVKMMDGEGDLEVGESYTVTAAKDRGKQDALFKGKGRFVFNGMTNDGKISISLPETGEIINVTAEDFAEFKVSNDKSTANKTNAQLFQEVSGNTFTFNMKKNGEPVQGYLEYDGKKDRLYFRTIDGKRVYAITRDQFRKPDDSTPAAISIANGELSDQAKLLIRQDVSEAEILEKYRQKTEVIGELITEATESYENHLKQIKDLSQQIDKIENGIKEALTTKDGKPRKKITDAIRATVSALSTQKEKLSKQLSALEQGKEDLQNSISYLKTLLDYKDEIPENYKDVAADLNKDLDNLSTLEKATTENIDKTQGLIDDISKNIYNALKLLKDYIDRVKSANKEVPLFSDVLEAQVDSYLLPGGLDKFMAEKQAFFDSLADFREQLDVLGEDVKNLPSLSTQLESLQKELQSLRDKATELTSVKKKLMDAIKPFEAMAKSYEKRALEEQKLRDDAEMVALLLQELNSVSQMTLTYTDKFGGSRRKDAYDIPNATIVPSELFEGAPLAEHHIRANYFGANFSEFPNKSRIRGILVTSKNEESLGLSGLIEYIASGGKDLLSSKETNNVDRERVIALVFVEESDDGTVRQFVDAKGQILKEAPTPQNLVYQVFPLEKLEWATGDSMFRRTESAILVNSIKQRYAEWRAGVLNNPPTRSYGVAPSAGHPLFVEYEDGVGDGTAEQMKYKRFSVRESGHIKETDLTTTNLLTIPTTNKSMTKGFITFESPLGRVFLNLANKFVNLYNRRFNEKEADTIFKVLLRYSQLAQERKLKTPEAMRLLNWLKSVTYWGVPRNTEDAGYNSIWFDKVAEGGLRLFMGKERKDYVFTPLSLQDAKAEIIGNLRGMYNNVDANKAGESRWNERYEEIIDIDEQGQPVVRMVDGKPYWPNYQTYLLSDKNRKNEEIPLRNIYRPITGEEMDTNVEGVYFVINNEEVNYHLSSSASSTATVVKPLASVTKTTPPPPAAGVKPAGGTQAAPTKKAAATPTFGKSVRQAPSIDLTGAPNAYKVTDTITIYFSYDPKAKDFDIIQDSKYDDVEMQLAMESNLSNNEVYNALMDGIGTYIRAFLTFKALSAYKNMLRNEQRIVDLPTGDQELIDKYLSVDLMKQAQAEVEKEKAATFTPTTPYGTPTGPELTTSTESVQAKKAAIEKRREDELNSRITPPALKNGFSSKDTRKSVIDSINRYAQQGKVLNPEVWIKIANEIFDTYDAELAALEGKPVTPATPKTRDEQYQEFVNTASIEELIPVKGELKVASSVLGPKDKEGSITPLTRMPNDEEARLENWLLSRINSAPSPGELVKSFSQEYFNGVGNWIEFAERRNSEEHKNIAEKAEKILRLSTGDFVKNSPTIDKSYLEHVAYVWAKMRTAGRTTQSLVEFYKNPKLDDSGKGVLPSDGASTPTQQQLDDYDNLLNDPTIDTDDSELRRAVEADYDMLSPERWDFLENRLRKMFPKIPVYRVKAMMQNSNGSVKAWGMVQQGAIYLFEGAPEGTGYHEVFEAVWKFALTPEERAKAAAEFRKRSGFFYDRVTLEKIEYKNATDQQLKEELAEEFRSYQLKEDRLTGVQKVTGFIKKLFDELIEAIKTFFTGKQAAYNLERLFGEIGEGRFANYFPYESQLSLAKKGIIDIDRVEILAGAELSRVPGLSQNQVHELMESLTFNTVAKLTKENTSYFIIESVNKDALYKDLLNRVKKDIIAKVKVYKQEAESVVDDRERLDRLMYYEAQKQRQYGLIATIENNWDNLKAMHSEVLRSYSIDFDENDEVTLNEEIATGRENWQDSRTIDTYRKMSSAIKLMLATVPVLREDGKRAASSINGVRLHPTSRVYMAIMNRVHMASTAEDMLDRLRKMAIEDPTYERIYERLTRSKLTDTALNVSALDDHNLMLISAFYKVFNKQNPDIRTLYLLGDSGPQVGAGNFSSLVSQIEADLNNGLKMAVKKEGKFFSYDAKENAFVGKKGALETPENRERYSFVTNPLQSRIDFLNELNMEFTMEDLEKLAKIDATGKAMDKFMSAVGGIYKSINDGKRIVSVNKKVLSIATRIKQLAELKALIKNPEFSSTFYGIAGEKKQTFLGRNVISDLYYYLNNISNIRELKNTPYAYLYTKEGQGDVFSKYSVLLDKMFHPETGNKLISGADILKFSIAEGTVDTEKGNYKESDSLTFRQRLVQEINMNLDGYHNILVSGDGAIEAMVYTGVEGNRAVTLDDLTAGYSVVNEIFGNYFKAELELARQDRRITVPKNSGRKATDLRFFKDILGEDLHNLIIQEEGDVDSVYRAYATRINAKLKTFLESKVNNTFQTLLSYNIIERQLSESVREDGSISFTEKEESFFVESIAFSKNQNLSKEELSLFLLEREVNYIIANIEMHKLIYADPYQYEDELKRIKSSISPRQPIISDSPNLNSAYNNVWNKGYLENDTYGRTDFSRDYFNTVTLADISSYLEELGYGDFKETDGAGFITFKAARWLRIKAGDWNPDEERQYRYDVAKQKEAKNPGMLSAKEQHLIKMGNPQVASAYKPLKPIVFGNKLLTLNQNEVVLDKFALYPISFRLLDEFNAIRKSPSNLLDVLEKMENQNIDYAVYKSGRKVGAVGEYKLYDEKSNLNTAPFAEEDIVQVRHSTFSIQVEVPSKENPFVTRGSQATKLVTMDFMEAGVPVDYMVNEPDFVKRYESWYSLKEEDQRERESGLYKEIKNNESLLKQLTDEGYKNLLKRMGIREISGKEFIVEDFSIAAETVRGELIKREINSNTSEALLGFINRDVVIEGTGAYQQVRNILYSIVDKEIVRPQIGGGMLVQLPSTLLEGKRAKASQVNGKQVYSSDVLKFYTDKDGQRVMEVYIAPWFKSDLPEDVLFEKLKSTQEGRKLLESVAFRIPTQRQNSIDAIRIAGFLPKEYKNAVIVPSALVNKAGSDFDIDKLTVYLKNVFLSKEGNFIFPDKLDTSNAQQLENFYESNLLSKYKKFKELETKIGIERSVEELFTAVMGADTRDFLDLTKELLNTEYVPSVSEFVMLSRGIDPARLVSEWKNMSYRKFLENRYIDSMFNLVTSSYNFKRLTSPNSAQQLKDLSAKVVSKMGMSAFDYTKTSNMMDSMFMARLRHAFVSGKYAIGIAAVNNTNHSLSQRQPIYINKSKLSLQNREDREWLGDGVVNLPHNQITLSSGEVVATLSMIKNQERSERYPDGQDISEIISQFIDGYVDIAKGPWIMELGASPNVAGTWLFLVKLGVPIDTIAYFMNQPIIKDYLRKVENAGYSWLFIDDFVLDVVNMPKYKQQKEDYKNLSQLKVDLNAAARDRVLMPTSDKLYENLEAKSFDAQGKLEQQNILMEFLKYAKMSSQLLMVTQGSNYDTTSFNDPFLLLKKNILRNRAQSSIISSVEGIMKNSFLDNMSERMNDSRNALAKFLISDDPAVRNVLERILARYVDLPDRQFIKVGRKLVSDLFDWAVQVDEGKKLNTYLQEALTADDSYTVQINNFLKDIRADVLHPLHYNEVVREGGFLKYEISDKIGGTDNIKGTNANNKVFDQNQVIAAFRELRDYLGPNPLYQKLVTLSVLQSGLTASPISFTSLLPYEDFKDMYNDVISNIKNLDLEVFYETDSFERNNWTDDDMIPRSFARTVSYVDYLTGFPVYVRNVARQFLPENVLAEINAGRLPELISMSTLGRMGRSEFVVHTWEDPSINRATKNKMRAEGDYSYLRRGLFKKVRLSESKEPYIMTTNKGREYYIYKMINAWGDSYRAKEFYTITRPSVFQNGMLESNEIENDALILAKFAQPINKQIAPDKPNAPSRTMAFASDNIARIEAGLKTTTIRSEREGKNINIMPGETDLRRIGDRFYLVTNRGLLNVTEAGGHESMAKSEALPTVPEGDNTVPVKIGKTTYYAKYKQTRDFFASKTKLYVYDIKPAPTAKVIQAPETSEIEPRPDRIFVGYKDAAQRIAVEYPTKVITPTGEVFDIKDILESKKIGEKLAERLSGEAFEVKFYSALMDKFGEDAYTLSDDRDNAEEETTSTLEYINKLLKDNEIITDRSQLKLFTKDQLGPIQPDGLPPLNDTTQNSCG